MNVFAYGGGINSLALLIGLRDRKKIPDLILFSDTGAERPHTYEHIKSIKCWLTENKFPQIIILKKTFRDKIDRTIVEYCLERNELPSLAYGFKTCSQKFKFEPIDKYCNNNELLKISWSRGEKVNRLIGIDADEDHRATGTPERYTKKWNWKFPLIEWGGEGMSVLK